MVRATDWDGLACSLSNAVLGPETELVVLTPSALILQTAETPGTTSRVLLPARTRVVRLYTTDEAIRVALDQDPLLEPFSAETVTQAAAFAVGATVLTNQWHALLVDLDGLQHALHLTSTGTAMPRVRIEALVAP
jgi:hypothetical protein